MHEVIPLSPEHVEGARLFSDRLELVRHLSRDTRRVAEIGVAYGHGSTMLVEHFRPTEFHAIDLFGLHEIEWLWGGRTADVFKGKTHRDWYEDTYRPFMAERATELVLGQGDSFDVLSAYADRSFDVIYIDGAHQLDFVERDAAAAALKLANDGLLLFNDYIMYDGFTHELYGVVPVVNEMVERGGWRVVGLGLHPQMFCDIALVRR